MDDNLNEVISKNLGHATAYGYAVSKGYTGTEEEFAQLCADLGVEVERLEDMTVVVTMLEPDAEPSASYVDGTLTLNIPRGVKGDTGKSAYEHAVDGGYTGTEAEFEQLCADLGIEVGRLENMTVVVNMVAAGTQPSATYVNGTLTINIPSATDAQVKTAADAWLQENVSQETGYVLDRTLSLQNAAAPADLVGDLKSALNDNIAIVDKTAIKSNVSFLLVSDHYWNVESEEAVYTSLSGNWKANETPIPVNPGEIYEISGYQGTSHKLRIWIVTDSNYNILAMDEDRFDNLEHTSVAIIPTNGAYLLISNNTHYGQPSVVEVHDTTTAVVDMMTYGKIDVLMPIYNRNHYWNVEGTTAVFTELSSHWIAYEAISVKPGAIYRIKGCQGGTHKTRVWVVTDDSMNILAMAEDSYSTHYIPSESICVVPNGGTKLLVTTNVSVGQYGEAKSIFPQVLFTPQSLEDSEKAQARSNIEAASDKDVVIDKRITSFTLQHQYFWNIETNIAVLTPISGANWMASSVVPVSEGEVYRVSGDQGATHKTRIWVVTDDSMNVLAMAEDYYNIEDWRTETFTIPQGGTKLVMTTRSNVGSPYVYLYKIEKIKDFVIEDGKKLKGKKLSLLGDSISAYAGTIPDGNAAYYSGSNSGVTSPDQMWWKILCDKTGMIPLIINGWSGSGINWQTDSSHANIVPMSDDSRCNGLHDGSTTPDVILIAGGVNDYTYAQYAQNEPLEWDGKTVPGYTEPTTGKKVYNSFTEAYVAMIKKLQTNYPNAIVVALSTWFTMRGTDNGYVLTHTVGQNVYTQQNYNDKIRYVAEQMHIPYIDVSNIGFNRNNFYPTYAIDSSTIPTHPNAAGQAVMGKAIAEKIVELVSGYLT